jgi:hypothetical protein
MCPKRGEDLCSLVVDLSICKELRLQIVAVVKLGWRVGKGIVVEISPLHQQSLFRECKRPWLFEELLIRVFRQRRFVRKLLNVRSPWAVKFAEITCFGSFFNSDACLQR